MEVPPAAPASKQTRFSKQPAPALPSVEKKKASIELLSSASNNEALNADEITPQSTVAELLWERMFDGVTDALDPCLLAFSSLLACSTREHVAFHSRTREELRNSL